MASTTTPAPALPTVTGNSSSGAVGGSGSEDAVSAQDGSAGTGTVNDFDHSMMDLPIMPPGEEELEGANGGVTPTTQSGTAQVVANEPNTDAGHATSPGGIVTAQTSENGETHHHDAGQQQQSILFSSDADDIVLVLSMVVVLGGLVMALLCMFGRFGAQYSAIRPYAVRAVRFMPAKQYQERRDTLLEQGYEADSLSADVVFAKPDGGDKVHLAQMNRYQPVSRAQHDVCADASKPRVLGVDMVYSTSDAGWTGEVTHRGWQ